MNKNKVLIIEDDKVLLDSLRFILVRKDFDVLTALNGKTGIQIFKENNIDAVIVDIRMPEMDGFEVIEELQNIDKNISVIVFTGFRTDENYKKALEMGVFRYLCKPCDNKVIIDTLKEAVDIRQNLSTT